MLTIFFILGALPLVTPFKCYTCTHFESNVEIPDLSAGYSNDPACRDGNGIEMTSTDCASGSACLDTRREITGSVKGENFTAVATARACLDKDSSSNTCTPVNEPSIFVNGITVDKVKGRECICITENCNGHSSQSMPGPAIATFVISLVMFIFLSL